MKTLYLLRHAKAEPGSKELGDRDRPLSVRGREACGLIGIYIKTKGYKPSLIISSPAARTRETVERVVKAADINPLQQYIDKLYLATADEILHYVRLVNDTLPSVMVVGHNPGMHHAALVLAQAERSALRMGLELKYPTATLSVLQFDCEYWHELDMGAGRLIDFIMPGQLN